MAAIVENGPVKPHVQAFANEGKTRFGTVFTTYNGHSPTRDRALDCWDTDADLDALAQWGRENYRRFGIDYIIWKQRIWNPEIRDAWRPMAFRSGNNDPNHMKHVHFSFEPTGGTSSPAPQPKPKPDVQGDLAMLTFRYIYNGEDWVFDGPSKLFFQLSDTRQITEVLDKLGVKALGQVSDATHSRYSELAASAGFSG